MPKTLEDTQYVITDDGNTKRIISYGDILYALTGWTVEDIKNKRPDWTDKQCVQFLEAWEDEIVEKMVEQGHTTIENILANEYPKEEKNGKN